MEIQYKEILSSEHYNALREQVGWERLTEAQAKRGIEHTTFIVTAWHKETIVGMGRALFDYGYTAYLGDIIMNPQYQGLGIGKIIVQKLLAKVEAAAEVGDNIMVVLGAAKGKEGFYETLGFECRPNEHVGAGMTKYIKVNRY